MPSPRAKSFVCINKNKQNKKTCFFNYPGTTTEPLLFLSECMSPTIDHPAPLTPLQDSWSVSWISGRVNRKNRNRNEHAHPLVVVMASDVYL